MGMVQTSLPMLVLTLFGSFLHYGQVDALDPRASLRADNREIPAGGSVTLTCSVDLAADWRFYWFKQNSEHFSAFTVKNGTLEQNMSVSEEGIYFCKGGRGDPVFFTEGSNTVTIDKRKTHFSKAMISPKNSWSKMFVGERVSLTCAISDDGGTQWEYEWKTTSSETPPKTTEQWVFNTAVSSAGEYWCRGKQKMDTNPLTVWSYPIRLTVLSGKPKAKLNVDHFQWDGKKTLTCSVTTSRGSWTYFWYKADEPSEFLPTQDSVMSSDQILVSQTGLYWCRGGRGDPVFYTEFSDPLKVDIKEQTGSLITETHLLCITGLACGKLLLSLLLVLICVLRDGKGSVPVKSLAFSPCLSFTQSANSNQASAATQTIYLEPDDLYMTLRPGDIDIYESIHPNRNSDNGPEDERMEQTSVII